MRNPYRVMVWGPGSMGTAAIWEILQSPAFELVGVRVYSDSKNGKDIGEILGLDPIGIIASNDLDYLKTIECDCIFYTARDVGTFHTDDEIFDLLSSGFNVITPLPYQNAHLVRDQEFLDKLDAVCKKGCSVFHAPGVDPDLISERVLLSLTGACHDIKAISLREFWDCAPLDPLTLEAVGFGKPREQAKAESDVMGVNFLNSVAYTTEAVLGVKYDRIVENHQYVVTPEDIDGPIPIKAGTVGRLAFGYDCYIDAKGDKPFFSMQYNAVLGDKFLPPDVEPDQTWIATIEGRPSLKMAIDLKASIETGEKYLEVGNVQTLPGNHATMAPCFQAVPFVLKAEPGLLPSFGPSLHWIEDIRMFESR